MNPTGNFAGEYFDSADDQTVADSTTGLMWLRSGSDLGFFRRQQKWIDEINREKMTGFQNWRLPTLEEGLSLLIPKKIKQDLYTASLFYIRTGLHLFSKENLVLGARSELLAAPIKNRAHLK